MTENEQKIINKISDLSGDYKCYDNRISHEESLVLDRLLSENQQYREIGTVEECEKAMDFELAKQDKMLAEVIEDYLKYIKIGTIEEFKDLKEKSVAKKPTPIDYEKYMDVVTNAKFLRGACWCPNCKHTVLSGVCCGNCGQKLDWSVEE